MSKPNTVGPVLIALFNVCVLRFSSYCKLKYSLPAGLMFSTCKFILQFN